jgi:hypothetical protein
MSGFARSHQAFCARQCDEDAVWHVNIGGYWCGNCCERHKDLLVKQDSAGASKGIFIREEAKGVK